MRATKYFPVCIAAFLFFLYFAAPEAKSQEQTFDTFPDWSADGQHLAFVSTRSGNHDVWIMDANGQNAQNITPSFLGIEFDPQWSPVGDRIAFLSAEDEAPTELWVVSPFEQKQINLTTPIDNEVGRFSWSADGNYLAFVEFITTPLTNIWTVEADGSNLSNLTTEFPGLYTSPQWTPDGTFIVFPSDFRDDPQLIFVRSDDHTSISGLPVDVIEFDLEPQGQRIAFTAWVDETLKTNVIGLLDLEKSTVVILSPPMEVLFSDIAWAPNGESLIFTIHQGDQSDIGSIKLDTQEFTNLTSGQGKTNTFPSWSPDSERIAFQSNRSGDMDIWVMNSDGTEPVNLTAKS